MTTDTAAIRELLARLDQGREWNDDVNEEVGNELIRFAPALLDELDRLKAENADLKKTIARLKADRADLLEELEGSHDR
jgi:cell division protein FtsB